MLEETRKWMRQILELLLWLVAVLILIQILFPDAKAFFGMDVIGNLGELVSKFGNAGLVGVIAASIVAYYIVKNRDDSGDGGNGQQTGGSGSYGGGNDQQRL
ncbi:MAG: hypothetical protein CFH10_01864 [Alphaproteobacteria bacterium MarineAlpha4_Bin2]|mgnify:CR=1 FL=1|nr:MAG: hypothetical protein CFH10_01864 [Alphaproteobacteria bacterium MarineAlpha4_Bin2]